MYNNLADLMTGMKSTAARMKQSLGEMLIAVKLILVLVRTKECVMFLFHIPNHSIKLCVFNYGVVSYRLG